MNYVCNSMCWAHTSTYCVCTSMYLVCTCTYLFLPLYLCSIRQSGSLAGAWCPVSGKARPWNCQIRGGRSAGWGCIMQDLPTLWTWWTSMQVRISTYKQICTEYVLFTYWYVLCLQKYCRGCCFMLYACGKRYCVCVICMLWCSNTKSVPLWGSNIHDIILVLHTQYVLVCTCLY